MDEDFIIDEGFMAEAIAAELNKAPWSAIGLDTGEIFFTDENGVKYILAVTHTEVFPEGFEE